ncbi:MAG: family 78 glycoside hydrolase catalytic domain [Clostridia bacterium]|nr:family 78 glycoside hydrolase catalytic domain [Clostridia bacterium]
MKMQFITPETPFDCPRFIRNFSAKNAVSATLQITGLGLYRAELNGARVGADYLTPGFNDYDAYLRYQTYDVTALIKEENRLAVTLGRGWAMSRLGPSSGAPWHWGRRYLLAARLTLTFADGRTETVETDESWRAVRSPVTLSELYDGEHRDDTRQPGAPVPCLRVETACRLEEPLSPPIREVGQLRPRLIITPKGERVLDFGQNFAGVIRFFNRLPRGASILLQTGEVLQQGCFYRDNLNTALSEYRYTSDGVCKAVEPLFCFYGFRYARVTCQGDVDPADFTGVVLSSDLTPTLQCETDHPQLNRLLQNALWSQRSNFLDVPTDCPQRDERLGWLGDAQVFAATACYQLDCKAFYRKFIRDMREEQTRYYGGDLPMYVPSLRGEAGPGGAVWADAATVIPWQVYMAYGDRTLLRESYPLMRDYTESLIRADQRLGGGHLRFDAFTFGDWLAQDGVTDQSVFGGTEHAFIQGVYYMQSAALTGQAAEALGETADAARYAALAAEIRRALTAEYITPGGRLALDTQTAYVLALRHGLGGEKVKDSLRDRLRRDGYAIRCGFTGAPLMIGALLDAGMADEAYRILFSPDFPG